jgi:hypothetical protein
MDNKLVAKKPKLQAGNKIEKKDTDRISLLDIPNIDKMKPSPPRAKLNLDSIFKKTDEPVKHYNDFNDGEVVEVKKVKPKPVLKKKGGWIQGAVNPAHKGYCTPMTKSTCTPKRKAFALTMKKHHGFHKKQNGGEITRTTGGVGPRKVFVE